MSRHRAEQRSPARRANIRDDLTPGRHTMHCELLKDTDDPAGGHEFRVISLMRYARLGDRADSSA